MSAAYPVMLDVARLRVLVVGGGAVALRKVRGVLEAGGSPEVVSPALTDELRALVERRRLVWLPRPYQAGDACGRHLVFAATGSPGTNTAVAREAEEAGALVSLADDGEGSLFTLPAVLREGGVTVALSTGGASPLLARRIRDRLAAVVTPGLGRAALRLARLRGQVQARWPGDEARRRAFWFSLVTPELIDAAAEGRDEDVEARIARCLSPS